MATNKQLKFFKGASFDTTPVAGMIWFCTEDRTIRVYTGTEWEKYAGLVNANWNGTDKLLTITNAAGVETKLDLSDCASAKDITAKLTTINNTLTDHDGRITTAQAAAEAAQAHSEGVAGNLATEVTNRGNEITRVEGLISAEATTARAAEEANAAAALAADNKAAAAQAYAEGVNTALGKEVERAESAEKGLDDRLKLVEGAIGDGGSVSDAITDAIEALDADKSGESADKKVKVQVVEVDGKIDSVVVTTDDIASAQALADEISARGVAEQSLSDRIEALAAAETGRVSVLEEQVRALNAATHFEGKVEGETFEAAIEAAVADGKYYEAGDIVIYVNKEFIYDGENWIELGDTTAESNRISALEGLVGSKSVSTQIDEKIAALSDETKSSEDANLVKVTVSQADGNVTGVSVDDAALDAKFKSTDDAVALNTAAVADYKTRIEALEATAGDLDSTYVNEGDYAAYQLAVGNRIGAVEGRMDTAEGEIDTLQAAIERLDGEQATQNTAIEAADAKGAQGIADAAAALAKAEAKVATVTAGNHISVGNDDKNPVVSVNVIGQIAEGNTGLVNGGAIFNELCWVEFE